MAKDLIFMVNTTSTSIAANSSIPLTTISRRRGCTINSNGNGVTLNRPGYYQVNGSVTFTAPATGDVVIALTKNGMPITGITATETVATALTDINTLSFSGIVRVLCGEIPTVLTIVNTGNAITTSNVNLSVEYLG